MKEYHCAQSQAGGLLLVRVKEIVEIEIQRIKDDPNLCHLLQKEE